MTSTTNYKGLEVLTPDPVGDGGLLINDNFKNLADRIGPSNYSSNRAPVATDDLNSGYYAGSRWLNTSNSTEYICLSNSVGAATWLKVSSTNTVSSVNSMVGDVTLTTDSIEQGISNLYYDQATVDSSISSSIDAQKGVVNGVASLDNSGKIPSNQLPAVQVNTVFTVAIQANLVGLTTAVVGDIAIVTGSGTSYILANAPYSVIGNWVSISSSGAVTSVNGQVGNVTLTTSNITEGSNKYYLDSKVLALASTTAGNKLVLRDAHRNFSAGMVTANLNGTALSSLSTSQNTLNGCVDADIASSANGDLLGYTTSSTGICVTGSAYVVSTYTQLVSVNSVYLPNGNTYNGEPGYVDQSGLWAIWYTGSVWVLWRLFAIGTVPLSGWVSSSSDLFDDYNPMSTSGNLALGIATVSPVRWQNIPQTSLTIKESQVTGLINDLSSKVPYGGATGDFDLNFHNISGASNIYSTNMTATSDNVITSIIDTAHIATGTITNATITVANITTANITTDYITTGYITTGNITTANVGKIVTTGYGNQVQLNVKSNVSQTADLQTWTDSNNNVLSSISSAGCFTGPIVTRCIASSDIEAEKVVVLANSFTNGVLTGDTHNELSGFEVTCGATQTIYYWSLTGVGGANSEFAIYKDSARTQRVVYPVIVYGPTLVNFGGENPYQLAGTVSVAYSGNDETGTFSVIPNNSVTIANTSSDNVFGVSLNAGSSGDIIDVVVFGPAKITLDENVSTVNSGDWIGVSSVEAGKVTASFSVPSFSSRGTQVGYALQSANISYGEHPILVFVKPI